jgi:hypothetical protein
MGGVILTRILKKMIVNACSEISASDELLGSIRAHTHSNFNIFLLLKPILVSLNVRVSTLTSVQS